MKKIRQTKLFFLFKRIIFIVSFYILNLLKIKNRLFYLSKWIKEVNKDYLLTNYQLYPESLVIDVGGYTGIFSDRLLSVCDTNLIIFEPVSKYYKILKNKYANNHKVKIYNSGLSDKNYKAVIFVSNDSTSIFKKTGKAERVKFVDVNQFIKSINKVDLMSINIEGSEYKVLNRMINSHQIKKIKYIQIQFHNFVPNAKKMRLEIIKKILKTHKIRYSYPFVWESFELKV